MILQPAVSDTYVASLALNPTLRAANSPNLADLAFLPVPNLHSAIKPLTVSPPVGQRSGGQLVSQPAGVGGRVIIIATEPVLDIGAGPILTLYGHPGANYALEHRTNLVTAPWIRFNEFTLDDRFASITNAPVHDPMTFYRAYEFPSFGLTLENLGGPVFSLILSGGPGASYLVQTSTNLASPAFWSDLFNLTLINAVESFSWTNPGVNSLYFRAVKQ